MLTRGSDDCTADHGKVVYNPRHAGVLEYHYEHETSTSSTSVTSLADIFYTFVKDSTKQQNVHIVLLCRETYVISLPQ